MNEAGTSSPYARALVLAAVVALVSPAARAAAPEKVIEDKTEKEVKEETKDPGWQASVDLGASFSLAHTDSVVGKLDGVTITLGANIAGGVSYIKGLHDWRARLSINLAFTQSPVVDQFVKSTDMFHFDTAYYIRAIDWVGPFARFALDTSMLPGYDVRASASEFAITKLDGSVDNVTTDALSQTDAFLPLTLKQSLGAFLRPYTTTEAELEARVGFGAREVIANGQLQTTDDKDTETIIEVTELDDSHAVGAEFAVQLSGSLEKGKVSYLLAAEVLIPFAASQQPGDDRSLVDLTNADFNAKISFKLVEWASLDYEFRATLQPQLVEEWQIQNMLLLTFGYGFKYSEADAAKKPAEAEPTADASE